MGLTSGESGRVTFFYLNLLINQVCSLWACIIIHKNNAVSIAAAYNLTIGWRTAASQIFWSVTLLPVKVSSTEAPKYPDHTKTLRILKECYLSNISRTVLISFISLVLHTRILYKLSFSDSREILSHPWTRLSSFSDSPFHMLVTRFKLPSFCDGS